MSVEELSLSSLNVDFSRCPGSGPGARRRQSAENGKTPLVETRSTTAPGVHWSSVDSSNFPTTHSFKKSLDGRLFPGGNRIMKTFWPRIPSTLQHKIIEPAQAMVTHSRRNATVQRGTLYCGWCWRRATDVITPR